jgi:hypothetical protein
MRQDAYSFESLAANSAVPEIIREWLQEKTGQTVSLESEAGHASEYLGSDTNRLAFLVGEGMWASWVTIRPDRIETSDRLRNGIAGHGKALADADIEGFLNELSFLTAVYDSAEVIEDVSDSAGYRTLTIRA